VIEAKRLAALVVNFAGGAVVTPRTSEKAIAKMKEMKEQFDELLEKFLAA